MCTHGRYRYHYIVRFDNRTCRNEFDARSCRDFLSGAAFIRRLGEVPACRGFSACRSSVPVFRWSREFLPNRNMPTLPAGVPVPRRTDEFTQEDAFQTEHILEQSTENRALQSDFIAVSQSDQVTDPIQPTSFLTNCSTMLQTSHSHSGATISLNDALCAGQAQYTNLLFVKRSGQQWILEVTQ